MGEPVQVVQVWVGRVVAVLTVPPLDYPSIRK